MDVTEMGLVDASRRIHAGELSPLELTHGYLDRIDVVDPHVRSFSTVAREQALAQARERTAEIAAGAWRGPLHGIPIAIKDLVATDGVETAAGSKVLEGHVPHFDAPVAFQLRAAGAVILGKAVTHEFAIDVYCPPARNPWDLDRITGGSSGGSAAAVASRLCLGAVGTDTSGSIRIPASLCGVSGLKPTFGRVNCDGVVPFSWSLDHVGPIAMTAADLALLLGGMVDDDDELFGTAHKEPPADLDGVRIGWPTSYFFDELDTRVADSVNAAVSELVRLGATVSKVDLPSAEHAIAAGDVLTFAEASLYHRRWIEERPAEYQAETLANFQAGALILAVDYLQAQRVRDRIAQEFAAAFREVDVIVAPSTPIQAMANTVTRSLDLKSRSESPLDAYGRLTYPASLAGIPAVSIPCGISEGLPVGLQLIGRHGQERRLLAVAATYQAVTDWHQTIPTAVANL
jgi:aspartyl-tRNA(Asn)/glutamyl-tRNA(Gln) amidotransferase subunit A